MAGLTAELRLGRGWLAVAVALIRADPAPGRDEIGNFWVDLTRGVPFVLLPLSVLLATVLLARG